MTAAWPRRVHLWLLVRDLVRHRRRDAAAGALDRFADGIRLGFEGLAAPGTKKSDRRDGQGIAATTAEEPKERRQQYDSQ